MHHCCSSTVQKGSFRSNLNSTVYQGKRKIDGDWGGKQTDMNDSKIPVERCLPTILQRARVCMPPSPSLPQYVCSAPQASTACFWNAAKNLHSSYVVWDNPPPFLPHPSCSVPPTNSGWVSPLLSTALLRLYLYHALFLSWRRIFSLARPLPGIALLFGGGERLGNTSARGTSRVNDGTFSEK